MQNINLKQKFSIILIFVGLIMFVVSFLVYNTINDDYTIAKGDKVTEEWLRMGLYDNEDIPDILYSLQNSKAKELPQLEAKMNMCIVGIIISLLVCALGLVVLVISKKSSVVLSLDDKEREDIDIKVQLTKLNELYDTRLITEEEFSSKKKDLLDKL